MGGGKALESMRGFTQGLGCVLLCATAVCAAPSPLEQGVEALMQRRFDEALEKFRAVFKADPTDGQAAFFEGVTLNRLGRPLEAVPRFEDAERLKFTHPDSAFEYGWALLGVGRWRESAQQLEAFEKAQPGRAQTLEFLGRDHFHLGDLDKAERLLNQAVKRDDTLGPTVRTYLALIRQRRGEKEAAERELLRVLRGESGTPLGGALDRFTDRYVAPSGPPPQDMDATPQPTDKPWRISISLGGGWNSNALSVGDSVALPSDITNRGSAFGRFSLHGVYDLIRDQTTALSAGYALQADVFGGGLDPVNLHDHYWYLDYRRQIAADWTLSFRVSDQYTNIGGSHFRNRAAVRPAIAHRVTDWLAIEVGYTFAYSDYFFAATGATNRDGVSHTVAVTAYWNIPNTPVSGRIGYFYTLNNADGSDFDFDSHGLWKSVSVLLPLEITGEFRYTHIFSGYDNPNSFSMTGARRDEDVDSFSVQLTRPIPSFPNTRARLYVRFDYINNDSNIGFFDFDQTVVSAGVVFEF